MLRIDEKLKNLVPDCMVGVVEAEVKVKESSEELVKLLNEECELLTNSIKLEDLSSEETIDANRKAYKACGKNPSRYRTSSEALIRRVLQGKGIYFVNNIVDINNLISMKTQFSIGSYNTENIGENIVFTVGEDGDEYKGIGKDIVNVANMPVLADEEGKFGSPTSDSRRAAIDENAEKIMMCLFSFSGKDKLESGMNEIKGLLEKYADGKNIKTNIVE